MSSINSQLPDAEQSRPTVRYEAQSAPREGSRSAATESGSAWVGPFERVLGDHEEAGGTTVSGPDNADERPFQGRPLDVSVAHHATDSMQSPRRPMAPQQRSKSNLSRTKQGGEEDASSSLSSKASGPATEPPTLQQQSQNQQHLSAQSAHRLSSKVSNKALRAAAKTTGKTGIRSYGIQDADDDDAAVVVDRESEGEAATKNLARTSSGPSLLQVSTQNSEGVVVFDQLYLNHAPGLHPVHLHNNLSSGRSLLVRLESNLGAAVSFMRRKRIGPKKELDQLVWPSNTLAWAQGEGLAPHKLRELRAISMNLEVADSLILESGAATDIFVIFRSNMLDGVDDGNLVARQMVSLIEHGNSGTLPPLHSQHQKEAQGNLTVRAWPLGTSSSEDATQNSEASSSATSSRTQSMYSSSVSSSNHSIATALTDASEAEAQVVDVPFRAAFCRPQIGVSVRQPFGGSPRVGSTSNKSALIHSQGHVIVDFGDVVAGQNVETDLKILNKSDIDCFWQGRVEGMDSPESRSLLSLTSTSDDAHLPVVRSSDGANQYLPHILSSRGTHDVKLSVHSEASFIGDCEELLAITNLHNTSNTIRVFVRANIIPSPQSQGPLLIESSQGLDFGDCCGGHWTKQLLVMRNQADHALDVLLSAQKGFEVTFQMAELAPEDDLAGNDSFSVGATAASSEGSGASSGRATPAERSPAASDRGDRDNRDEESPSGLHTSTAMELARTPTHHATQPGPGASPPVFELNADSASPELERTPLVLTPYAYPPAPKHEPDENEDCDNSSVASQAGSRPASPVQHSDISDLESTRTPSGSEGQSSFRSAEGIRALQERKVGAKNHSVLAWRREASSGQSEEKVRNAPSSVASSGVGSLSTGMSAGYSNGQRQFEDDAVSIGSDAPSASSVPEQSLRAPSVGSASRQSHSSSLAPPPTFADNVSASNASTGLRSVDQKRTKEIENVVLRAGDECRVVVSYRPARSELDETFSAGRLVENVFRLTLDYVRARTSVNVGGTASRARGSRERRAVLCRTRTCTSFITVTPQELDFGEVNVGSRKSSQIVVANKSDLAARVDLRFVSKVLSMYRDEMTIPSGQTVHLTVDYCPRRVNLAYSKQITVANLLNRRNDQVVDVRGKNVDKQRISFHSLFYRILTPHGSNFLEFGDVNINCSRLRTFSIENTSKQKLVLDITAAHPEDLALYVKARAPEPDQKGNAVDGKPARIAKGYEDDEPSTIAQTNFSRTTEGGSRPDGSQTHVAGNVDRKERFLETISADTPASVRQENASWRTAQKLSHFRREVAPTSAVGSAKEGLQSGSGKAKPQVNMTQALRKGGKGRTTVVFKSGVTYKDRTLLHDLETLDLASGPPLVSKRISVKSRMFQTLDQIETGSKSMLKAGDDSRRGAVAGDQAKASPTSQLLETPGLASQTSSDQRLPSTPRKKLPSPLADDIVSKAGTPSRSLTKRLLTDQQGHSPALTGKKKMRATVLDPSEVSNLTLEELIMAIESQPGTLSTLFFNSPQAEEKFVRTEISLQRELRNAIQSKRLVPLGVLEIPPGEERQVVAVYCPNGSTRPHIQGTARKQDSRVFLRLVEYDGEAVKQSSEFGAMAELDKEELPIRDLMVRTTTARALLEVGQPHINLGQMEKGEAKTRKILLHNRSEWATSYCIRKSGSIASGDVKLSSGRYGVVPAHGQREVEFSFTPSLTGPFNEKLVIENVADRDCDLTVFLKATVHKKPNFTVEPAAVDFGRCKPGKMTDMQFFTVSNTTSKARTFVVAIDTHDLRHKRTIMDLIFATAADGESSKAVLSRAEENSIAEEIEHISQKLKIATRKGQEEKIKKYEDKLTELGVRSPTSQAQQPDHHQQQQQAQQPAGTEAVLEQGSVTAPATVTSDSSRLKRVSSTVTVGLAPNQSKRITLRVRMSAVHTAMAAAHSHSPQEFSADGTNIADDDGEDVNVNVRIHEIKNQDETRIVAVRARALWTNDRVPEAPGSDNQGRGVDGGDVDEVADPLPLNDGASIVFTPDM